ncbi:MAG: phosphatidylserine decarboxylase [Geodermatophilaceae bacterium]
MRIDSAGRPFIAAFAVPAVLFVLAGRRWLALPFAAVAGFMTLFFRDPDRSCDRVPAPADDVLAPADGLVVVAGDPEPDVAPPGDWQQVSIFLSPADVHMNRSPYRGSVTRCDYRPGTFLAAYRERSSLDNERSEIWLRDGKREVVFRQIVGVMARRIVTRTHVGADLQTGERVGLMKFGSRMDVFVPRDCTVIAARGDRVRGGETVIARWDDVPH